MFSRLDRRSLVSTKPMTRLERECAQMLRIPGNTSERRARGLMNLRLHELGHSSTCSRCGGSGKYSYNAVSGSRCFGGGGLGGRPPKVTRELLGRVAESVERGDLDLYLERTRMLHIAKKAPGRVLDAWGAVGVSDHYQWHSKDERDLMIGREVNRPMAEAYERVRALAGEVESLAFRLGKAKTAEQRQSIREKSVVKAEEVEIGRASCRERGEGAERGER